MKKRKILYLFPLAALVLSGCTLQEGWDVVKDFSVTKVYEPVRDFFLNLFGKEVPKKEEEQKPSGEGEGEGGGEHEEGETSKYGTQAKPLTVSEAVALIDSEDPTLETMYVTGEIVTNGAWNDQYQQIDFTISDGQVNLKVFRAVVFPDDFKASEVTANSMKGMSLVASGIGMTYGSTYEVASDAENGIMCTVLSFAGEPEEQGQVDNYGTAEHPLTVSEAIEVIKVQDPTNQPIYVTGEVSGNGDWYSAKSNIDIYLTDGENTIQMFRADKFPEGMDLSSVKKNDLVGKIVVGKGIGTYYVDGKKYELDQHCEVISMVDPVIEIEGVELSATELSLEVGQQASLTAKVLPEDKASQEVTWTVTSNDTPADVITCNNGTIVAQAVGTAVVTATSVADPSKTAECTVTVTEATKELLSLAFSGAPTKTEYVEGDEYDPAGLKVMAHYSVGEDEDVTANATIVPNKQYAEYGDTEVTFGASYGSLNISQSFAVTVSIKKGTESHPYSVAEARDAIDAGEGITGVYATGIVSKIVTAYNSQYGNVSFDMSADGSTTADQLQAYRCTVTSADDVAVGDTVTVKGNLKKYNSTYEFDAGCTIESRVQPDVESVTISGTPQTEYAAGANYNTSGLIVTAHLSNGVEKVVTNEATWEISKTTAELGDTEISITATYNNVKSAAFVVNVTVTSDGPVTPTYYDATMAKGTDAYDDGTVNGKACIKIGTSKKGGTMTITVPAGAVELKVYACAWNGVNGLSLDITSDKTGVTASPAALALTADTGASGNSPFTIADESIHLFTITLTGVTEQTVLTFTTSAAKRAIVWGAQYAL